MAIGDIILGQPVTQQDINQIQRQSVGETTEGNPRLPSSPPAQKLSLDTTNKIITRAINEVLSRVNTAQGSVDNFDNRFSDIIGKETVTNEGGGDLNQVKELYEMFENISTSSPRPVNNLIQVLNRMIFGYLDGEKLPALLNAEPGSAQYNKSINEYTRHISGILEGKIGTVDGRVTAHTTDPTTHDNIQTALKQDTTNKIQTHSNDQNVHGIPTQIAESVQAHAELPNVHNIAGQITSGITAHNTEKNHVPSVLTNEPGKFLRSDNTWQDVPNPDLTEYYTKSISDERFAAYAHDHTKANITDFDHTHEKADITDFNDDDYATAAQGLLADTAIQTETDPVAMEALDNHLEDHIKIGPAVTDAASATHNHDDRYATAAQGELADTALQTLPAGLVYTDDERLSDTRVPKDHNQAWSTITGAPNFVLDTDTRLTNARTPTNHTHADNYNGGTINYDHLTNKPSIPITDDTAPAALAASATAGTSNLYARRDHVHARPTASEVGATPASHETSGRHVSTGGVSGYALINNGNNTYSWGRYEIDNMPAPADVNPLAPGAVAIGTSDRYARQDHRHPLQPISGATNTISGIVMLAGTGNAGTVSRSDHTHATATSSVSGMIPALNNNSGTFLNGNGQWSSPPSGAAPSNETITISGAVGTNNRDTFTLNGTAKTITITPASIGAEPAITKNSAFNKDFGSIAGTVSEGNHSHTWGNGIPNEPSPPNNGVLTIKVNGTNVGTFSADQQAASDINIQIPEGTYTNPTPTTIAVGGMPRNTTFNGDTFASIFDRLFYPPIVDPKIISANFYDALPVNLLDNASFTIDKLRVVVDKGTYDLSRLEVFVDDDPDNHIGVLSPIYAGINIIDILPVKLDDEDHEKVFTIKLFDSEGRMVTEQLPAKIIFNKGVTTIDTFYLRPAPTSNTIYNYTGEPGSHTFNEIDITWTSDYANMNNFELKFNGVKINATANDDFTRFTFNQVVNTNGAHFELILIDEKGVPVSSGSQSVGIEFKDYVYPKITGITFNAPAELERSTRLDVTGITATTEQGSYPISYIMFNGNNSTTITVNNASNNLEITGIAYDTNGKQSEPFKVTTNITFFNMFNVTFNLAGGTADPNIINPRIREDQLVSEPTSIMTRDGHTFNGWNYNFANPITKNETITAQWNIMSYKVTLDYGYEITSPPNGYTLEDGKAIAMVNHGSNAPALPTNPQRDGFRFSSWTGNVNNIIGPRTITANWIEVFTVSFDLNNGTSIEPIKVENGQKITGVTNPVKEPDEENSFTFDRWEVIGVTIDLNTYVVTGNITLVAIWNEEPLSVPMFWWGNYIPETQVNSGVSASAVFNLDNLVDNINNSRIRYGLDWDWNLMDNIDWDEWTDIFGDADNIIINSDGTKTIFVGGTKISDHELSQYAITTGLRWQEVKHSDNAVKTQKDITWNNQLGFYYFISPKSFGHVTIDQDGMNQNDSWTMYERNIDNVDYYVYVFMIQINPYNSTHEYTFTN